MTCQDELCKDNMNRECQAYKKVNPAPMLFLLAALLMAVPFAGSVYSYNSGHTRDDIACMVITGLLMLAFIAKFLKHYRKGRRVTRCRETAGAVAHA